MPQDRDVIRDHRNENVRINIPIGIERDEQEFLEKYVLGSPIEPPYPKYGMEVEYFVATKHDNKILHAASIVPESDGNCSIGEIGTIPIPNWQLLPEAIMNGLIKHANHVAAKLGVLVMDVQFILAPITFVISDGVPLFKTCGVHWNQSNVPMTPYQRAESLVVYREKILPLLGYLQKARNIAPVIGPQSGKVYHYGMSSRVWEDKSAKFGVKDLWEFRPFPSGAWVFDSRALDIANRIVNNPSSITQEMALYFAKKASEPAVINAASLATPLNEGEVRLFHYGGLRPFIEQEGVVVLPKAYTPYIDAVLGDREFTPEEVEFFKAMPKDRLGLIITTENNRNRLLDSLSNKGDIAEFVPWDIRYFQHRSPRRAAWNRSELLHIEAYRKHVIAPQKQEEDYIRERYYNDDEEQCNCPRCAMKRQQNRNIGEQF